MTNDFKNIDELFKEAARNTSAPEYRSSYWKEMESLLAEEKSKRRGLVFSAISGTAAILGILAFVVFQNNHDAKYLPSDVNLVAADVDYRNELFNPTNKTTEISDINTRQTQSKTITTSPSITQTVQTTALVKNTDLKTLTIADNQTTPDLTVDVLPIITLSELESTEFETTAVGLSENHESFGNFNELSKNRYARVDAFAGLGMGQTHNGNGLSRSISAGVRMHYDFKKVRLTTGLGIQHEGNPGVDLQERSQVYSFGVTDFEHNLIYRSFTDLLIPLELGYNHKGHSFGLGVQARMLLTTRMSFESRENGSLQRQESLNGRTDGLNTLDADFYAFYSRELTDKLSLGLRVGHQTIGRIADHNYFSSSSKNSTLSGQVMISYQLGK